MGRLDLIYSSFSVIRSFCQICQNCITVEKNEEKNIPLAGLELQTLGLSVVLTFPFISYP